MTPRGLKRGQNEFLGKKRKRHILTLPKTKFHAKNQKNLSRGFPENGVRQTERERETETDPNIRVLRTLSLSRRTKKLRKKNNSQNISTVYREYTD